METPSAVAVTGRHRHRQPRKGLNDHDTTNQEVGTFLATSGDLNWPPMGTFPWPRTEGPPEDEPTEDTSEPSVANFKQKYTYEDVCRSR